MNSPSRARSAGFTLIELLVGMGVILLLAALLFTGARGVFSASDRAKCASNLRQIGTAIHTYVADNHGFLPPGARAQGSGTIVRQLEPYLGTMVTNAIAPDVWYCPANVRLGSPPPGGYMSPNVNYKGWSGYFFNYLFNASIFRITNGSPSNSAYVSDDEARVRLQSVELPTKTVALMDMRTRAPGASGPPSSGLANGTYFNPSHANFILGLVHSNRGNVLFLDGHVEAFSGDHPMPVKSLPAQTTTWWPNPPN